MNSPRPRLDLPRIGLSPEGSPPRPIARGLALLFVLGGLLLAASTLPAQEDLLARYAATQMQRKIAEKTMVDRANISRYFAVYPLPSDAAEGQRLLGTADRVMAAFLRRLGSKAAAVAEARGAEEIEARDVAVAVDELLPRAPTEFDTVIFFPERADLEVEEIDLEAFADTPFPWGTLMSASQQGPIAPLPLGEDAAAPIARALADYGLLVFRLGGREARATRARALASPHLREAEKRLARSAGGARADAGDRTAPQGSTPFTDITASVGIDFRHVSSPWLGRHRRYGGFAPTFSGGGVTARDLDGDGWPDLVACGGRGCVVYQNRGGVFEDVTEGSGLVASGEARMAVAADFDNDGDADLFLTFARDMNRLLENRGGFQFRDVTASSGLELDGDISGPAVAFDADGDGLLDLYVGNFGDYLAGENPWKAIDNENGQPNRLYRSLGDLRFEDVTEISGTGDTGWAQAISHADLDRDGDQDLYVANDFGRNELFRNLGEGRFEAAGAVVGADDEFHGMNVAFADLEHDGVPDIFVTNIWGRLVTEEAPGEFNKMLTGSRNAAGEVVYRSDERLIPELDEVDTGWAWAGLFFDADLDGGEDLMMLNGHSDYSTFLQYREHPTDEGEIYPIDNSREANVFFRNEGGILEIPEGASGAELGELNSRSLALLDADRDGDLDLAISTFHGPLKLLRNDSPAPGSHWLSVRLVGDPGKGVNRDAIGAEVVARSSDGWTAWRTVTGGEGYLGMSTLPVELGLGERDVVDLEVRWPGGERQTARDVRADRRLTWRQGEPEPVERSDSE